MDLDRLKKAVLCNDNQECLLLEGRFRCATRDCSCTEEKRFDTILDLYAFLFGLLDNVNYIDYETLAWNGDAPIRAKRDALEAKWKAHLRLADHSYRSRAYCDLEEGTRSLLLAEIADAQSSEELLIALTVFLFVLDGHLESLRTEYQTYLDDEQLPIATLCGDLLYRRDSELLRALQTLECYEPLLDPNYLLLRRKVRSFYVVRSRYSYYQVTHRYAPTPQYDGTNALDLKFGFLPGQFDVSKDYRIHTSGELTGDGLLPFYFSGVNDPEMYYGILLEDFRQLLGEKPHFLILPELSTPPELREELIKVFRTLSPGKAGSADGAPIFFMTGSFHERVGDNLYNLAKVVAGSGKILLEVTKMNRFIFPANPDYKGELARFAQVSGVEQNAYDRREVTFFETKLGRIAFFICVDFINYNVEEVLLDRQVDLIFIMSMTGRPASGKFVRRMQDLAERNGCLVVLCNNLGEPYRGEKPDDKQPRAVVSVPGFKEVFRSKQPVLAITLREIIEVIKPKPKPESEQHPGPEPEPEGPRD
ncbi:carbon-nitrogen hydrolase family protein [Cohnella fermenti]|uniref:Uncharacterized protein n=1 Tax=Cohnella fermenti TaxID=2565925 RepID=A0A4S4BEW3_9BACL|nr:hypothetical protein [Cohnella fermenti]THF72463.1 hypothetical protein E6C55_33015 [Cohnella fermenti]